MLIYISCKTISYELDLSWKVVFIFQYLTAYIDNVSKGEPHSHSVMERKCNISCFCRLYVGRPSWALWESDLSKRFRSQWHYEKYLLNV